MGTASPRRGEIWFVYSPGQPADPHQPRPALVISDDIRNRLTNRCIVVPIFSAGRIGPTRVPVAQHVGGLEHDSVLLCEEITTISYEFLSDGPIGSPVPASLLDQVIRGVQRALGEVVVEPGG